MSRLGESTIKFKPQIPQRRPNAPARGPPRPTAGPRPAAAAEAPPRPLPPTPQSSGAINPTPSSDNEAGPSSSPRPSPVRPPDIRAVPVGPPQGPPRPTPLSRTAGPSAVHNARPPTFTPPSSIPRPPSNEPRKIAAPGERPSGPPTKAQPLRAKTPTPSSVDLDSSVPIAIAGPSMMMGGARPRDRSPSTALSLLAPPSPSFKPPPLNIAPDTEELARAIREESLTGKKARKAAPKKKAAAPAKGKGKEKAKPKAKPRAKGKGKGKQEEMESDEDEDEEEEDEAEESMDEPAGPSNRRRALNRRSAKMKAQREESLDPEAELMEEERRAKEQAGDGEDDDEDEDGEETSSQGKRKRGRPKGTRNGDGRRSKKARRSSPAITDRLPDDIAPGEMNGPIVDPFAMTMEDITSHPGGGRVSKKGIDLQKHQDELIRKKAERRAREIARARAAEEGQAIEEDSDQEELDAALAAAAAASAQARKAAAAAAPEKEEEDAKADEAMDDDDDDDDDDEEGGARRRQKEADDEFERLMQGIGKGDMDGNAVQMIVNEETGEYDIDQTTTRHNAHEAAQNGVELGEGDDVEEINDSMAMVNSHSFAKKPRAKRWDKAEDLALVMRLKQFGETLDMLIYFFPTRNRKQLSTRINRFLNNDRELLREVMMARPSPTDYKELEEVSGIVLSKPLEDHAVLHEDESIEPKNREGTPFGKAAGSRARSDRASSVGTNASGGAGGRGGRKRGKKGGGAEEGIEYYEGDEQPADMVV